MKPTASEGRDCIPMKAIKAAIIELAPLILLLVNSTIKTRKFPIQLKTTKIIPIRKPDKDKNISDGWRPINIVQSLSKIIERVYLRQIIQHIKVNNLVNHSHHGGIRGKSTQSILTEVHDNLVETLENGEDAALVLVDQSKAFDIIDHEIMIEKLRIIGFTKQAIQIIKDYLCDRRQYVAIQNSQSDLLVTGPRSVVQGSTLSGVLYLIFILDLPYLTHETIHTPETYRKCKNANIKTFVDDCMAKVPNKPNSTLENEVTKFMKTMENYAASNKLIVNPDKTKVMIVSKNKEIKQNFNIILNGQEIKHSKQVTILGIKLSEDLLWESHVNTNLLPQIKNRVRCFKIIARYLSPRFKTIYANAIYRSKLLYGIDSWGGISKTTTQKIQVQQNIMAKTTLGKKGERMSAKQRERTLNWLPIYREIEMSAARTTFKILLDKTPEEIASVMPQNVKGLRIKSQRKLDTKPVWLTKTKLARSIYRARAYKYNILPAELTQMSSFKDFKKDLKKYFLNKY